MSHLSHVITQEGTHEEASQETERHHAGTQASYLQKTPLERFVPCNGHAVVDVKKALGYRKPPITGYQGFFRYARLNSRLSCGLTGSAARSTLPNAVNCEESKTSAELLTIDKSNVCAFPSKLITISTR